MGHHGRALSSSSAHHGRALPPVTRQRTLELRRLRRAGPFRPSYTALHTLELRPHMPPPPPYTFALAGPFRPSPRQRTLASWQGPFARHRAHSLVGAFCRALPAEVA